MTKKITDSQILGELGETAVKKLVLEMGMIYEHRGRLEAGIDGLVELRDVSTHAPLGKLLGVQVKSTAAGKYLGETADRFDYLLRTEDLAYWAPVQHPGDHCPVETVRQYRLLERGERRHPWQRAPVDV